MKRLIFQILAAIFGLFLATKFLPGVRFTESWQILILAGLILGLVNFFLKPILKLVTLPLRILTFGLFTLVINIVLVWIVDLIFPQLKISGISNLFLITIFIWSLNFLFQFLFK